MSINEDLVYLCGLQGLHICNLEGNQPGIIMSACHDWYYVEEFWKNSSTLRSNKARTVFMCASSCALLLALLWWGHKYMCLIPGSIKLTIFHLWCCQQPSVLSSHPWSSSCCVCSYRAISVVSASRLLFAIMSLNFNQRQSMKTSVKGFSDAMIEFICWPDKDIMITLDL